MAVLPLRFFPDPVLRTRAAEVTVFDDSTAALISDMMETMYDAGGVGLAAPQIGISQRVFVFDCGDGNKGHVINPELEIIGDERQSGGEGCLSVPGLSSEVTRYNHVKVRGVDAAGQPVEYEGTGLLARCFQHETDHLNGQLYIHRLKGEARKQIMAAIRRSSWF